MRAQQLNGAVIDPLEEPGTKEFEMPISMATITEAKPTSSDSRVPYMIELSTSRP